MEYEWDDKKNAVNFVKHGTDFTLMEGFDWSSALIVPDGRHVYGEPRFSAFGYIGDRLYVCAHTWRDHRCRIINLRKANDRERKNYNEKN